MTLLHVEASRSALLRTLEAVAAVVPNRDFVPVLSHVLCRADDHGLTVTGTNMARTLTATLSAGDDLSVLTPGTALLPLLRLMALLREAVDGTVSITVDEQAAEVAIAPTKWVLRMPVEARDFPAFDHTNLPFVAVSRTMLLSAIAAVRYAAARDSLRASLMLLDVSKGVMRASDGTRCQQIAAPGLPDMQVPLAAVDDLTRLLRGASGDTVEVAADAGHQVSRTSDRLLAMQRPTTIYPNVEAALLKPALANNHTLTADRDALAAAVKRVRVTADRETHAVVLHLSADKIVVTSTDRYGSRTEESVAATWGHPERSCAFNHVHLLELLAMHGPGTCTFALGKDMKSRLSVLLLRDDERSALGTLHQITLLNITNNTLTSSASR